MAFFYFYTNKAGVVVAPSTETKLPIAGETAPTTDETTAPVTPSAPVTVSGRLVKISAGPVVLGEVVMDVKANASSSAEVAVSYIERQSGNIYSYLVHAGTLTRISNRTVPGIQSAQWLKDGSLAFVRYLSGTDFSSVNSYGLPSNGSGGFFLPQNLSGVAVSSTSILMLASGVNGSVASVANTDGTKSSEVFTTPLSSLRASFAGKNQYLAYTKPSATLPGAAFLVSSTGHFTRVAGPLYGLTAIASPSGKWLLVSYVNDDRMQMKLVNTTTGESLPLPVATIADKCVWTNDDASIYCGVPVNPLSGFNYPDDWYQGAVSFSDRIWKIQVAGRYAQFVLDFSKETDGSLDAEALAIDPLNSVLVFLNKNDGSLWSYSL